MKNYSLFLIKPDAVARGIEQDLVNFVKKQGLNLVNRKKCKLSMRAVSVLYKESMLQPYYFQLVESLVGKDVIFYLVIGYNAVFRLNKIVGLTDPVKAGGTTIRGKYGISILNNSVHSSNENRVDEEVEFLYGKTVESLIKKI